MSMREVLRRAGWLDSLGLAGVLVITIVAFLAAWLTPFDPLLRVGEAHLAPLIGSAPTKSAVTSSRGSCSAFN